MASLKFTALLLAAGLAPCFADIVYDQPATDPGGIASQQCTGCFGGGDIDYVAFDDFRLFTSRTIETVLWQGAYGGPGNQVTDFTIGFYRDNGGVPGALIQSYDTSGNANETLVAKALNGFTDYAYEATLSSPFATAANTTYWLSIQAKLYYPPQWFWRAGTGGDGESVLIQPDISNKPVIIPEDSAFALSATATPEPSLLWLGIFLFVTLVMIRWRRRQLTI